MFPTLLAADGSPNIAEELKQEKQVGNMNYKVHLDGYNQMPALQGKGDRPPDESIYWTDDGNVAALRYAQWKITFRRQNAHGLEVWQRPFEELRASMLADLRSDPFERAEYESIGYREWYLKRMFAIAPAGA